MSGRSASPFQQVAVTRVGDDVTARIRVVTKLQPQPPYEKIDALGSDVRVDAVDLAEDLVARDGHTGVAGEVLHEPVLEGTELDGAPADADAASHGVDLHLAESHLAIGRNHRRRPERAAQPARLPELCVEPGDELAFTHGLGDVVVGACVEPAGHARLVVAPAD